eukprot:12415902-Karenia_brevis.AAC.1
MVGSYKNTGGRILVADPTIFPKSIPFELLKDASLNISWSQARNNRRAICMTGRYITGRYMRSLRR